MLLKLCFKIIFTVLYTLLIIWMQQKRLFATYMFVQLVFYYYFRFCSQNIYFFGSLSLKLAYFAAQNWLGWNFSVNFHYQRCQENSNLISFGFTSSVTLCSHILYYLFSSLLLLDFPWYTYHHSQTVWLVKANVWWKCSLSLIIDYWSSRVCFLV